jgi:DNA invertase Pin-like site-specific DNA recombinase
VQINRPLTAPRCRLGRPEAADRHHHPSGRLAFHILGAIDEFQRELIVEGTREGLDAARARGRVGGRKPKLNARQAATVRRMYRATGPDGKRQHAVAEIAEAVGVHRTTVYDYLNKER